MDVEMISMYEDLDEIIYVIFVWLEIIFNKMEHAFGLIHCFMRCKYDNCVYF